MTNTVIRSRSKSVTIGFDQSFVAIGECINPTNSVTGEDERLERVLPLVRKYGCDVIVDPLVMQLVGRLREEFHVNTSCGAWMRHYRAPAPEGGDARGRRTTRRQRAQGEPGASA